MLLTKDFEQVNLNVLICDINGGSYEGGYTVFFQQCFPYDEVTHAAELKHNCVFIDGTITMPVTKCEDIADAVTLANIYIRENPTETVA